MASPAKPAGEGEGVSALRAATNSFKGSSPVVHLSTDNTKSSDGGDSKASKSRGGHEASMETTCSSVALSSAAAGGVVCLVLEYLAGGSLLTALEAGQLSDATGMVTLEVLWPLLMDVSRGMAALHAMGVCHGGTRLIQQIRVAVKNVVLSILLWVH